MNADMRLFDQILYYYYYGLTLKLLLKWINSV